MDVERIEALARLLHGSKAQELLVETESWRVGLRKAPVARPPEPAGRRAAAAPAPPQEPVPPDTGRWITAPLVGIFRQTTRLLPGDEVTEGQAVGAIESLKILNPLISDLHGEVTEVLVEDGQPVEYGQPLLQIRPREGDEEGE